MQAIPSAGSPPPEVIDDWMKNAKPRRQKSTNPRHAGAGTKALFRFHDDIWKTLELMHIGQWGFDLHEYMSGQIRHKLRDAKAPPGRTPASYEPTLQFTKMPDGMLQGAMDSRVAVLLRKALANYSRVHYRIQLSGAALCPGALAPHRHGAPRAVRLKPLAETGDARV